MPAEQHDIERFLEVGSILILHTDPNRKDGPRYKTILRGWRKGAHMLMDRPKTEMGMFVALQEGQTCVFRFLYQGLACAFDAMILDWDTRRSNPYLRVQYPQEIQYLQFRKFERVQVQCEASVTYANGTRATAEVRDVSIGGCGIFVTGAPPEDVKRLVLSFTLPDGVQVDAVRSVMRSVRDVSGGHVLGLEFEASQERVQDDISFYVSTTLSREKAGGMPTSPVLIVDGDTDQTARLRRNLERQNIDVFAAATSIDGICRLRTVNPRVLLVSGGMADFPAADLCRLIIDSGEFKQLHVIVYGGDPEGLQDAARTRGIHRYFPSSNTLAPDIAFEVSKLLKDED